MASKKKILFLITKSNWGGAQRYVYDLATHLPPDEFDVSVAAGGQGVLISKLETVGINVVSIPSLERDVSLVKEALSLVEMANIIRREQPDILHINSSKAGIMGALLGRLLLVPSIVFTAHGWAFNEDRPKWQRFILKVIHWLTVLLTHKTIAVSNEVRLQMDWPLIQNKFTVIHNGRTVTHFHDRETARRLLVEREPSLLPHVNDFWSVTIAELHPIKRHDAVIETFKEVVAAEPNTRHLIIGGGEQKEYLSQKIHELSLEDHVFLIGPVDEAAEYLKAADLFILASRSEAMPYVLIEAQGAGLPIIATSVGGVSEIIESEVDGILTPPLDNKALFSAILSLRRDEGLRSQLASGAIRKSLEFSLENTLAKTIALYRA